MNFSKSLIALMMTVCLLVAIALPYTAFAANEWDGYALVDAVANSDGSVTMTSKSGSVASVFKAYPVGTKYVMDMSIKVSSFSGETGIQISNGSVRAMMYLFAGQLVFAGGSTFGYAIGNEWHDYSLVVKGTTAEVYIDDEYVGDTILQSTTAGGTRIYFWCKSSGSDTAVMSIKDVEYVSGVSASSDADGDEMELPPTKAFYQDFSNIGDWNLTDENVWIEKGGDTGKVVHLNSTTKSTVSSCLLYYNPTAVFDIEYRLKITQYDGETGMKAEYGPYRTFCYFHENYINLRSHKGSLMISADVGKDWHTYRLKIDNGYAWFYMDGALLAEYPIESYTPEEPVMSFWVKPSAGTGAEIYVDWVRYTPVIGGVAIRPLDTSEYVEGQTVVFSAVAADAANKPAYVDYAVNGELVGRGITPDYEFKWKNAPYGEFEVNAIYNDTVLSQPVNLYVRRNFGGQIIVPPSVKSGENVTISTKAYHGDGNKTVEIIEYSVNGRTYTQTNKSENFAVDIGSFAMGKYCISATATDSAGITTRVDDKWLLVNELQADGAKVGLEYNLAYDVLGRGSISASDGVFGLSVKHTENTVVVETADGDVILPLGNGSYGLAVRSGILDISVNGAFEKSLRMPIVGESVPLKSHNLNNLTIDVPTGRDIYAQGYGTIEAPIASNLTYWSLEFTKNNQSAETIDYYDGIYHLALSVGAEITAVTAPDGKDKVESILADVQSGKHFYRVTCFNGIAQLFIDNVYIDSMRLPKSSEFPILERKNAGAGDMTILRRETEEWTFSTDFENAKTANDADYWLGNVSVEEYELPGTAEVTITMKNNIVTVSNAPNESMLITAFYKDDKLVNVDKTKGSMEIVVDVSNKKADSEIMEIFLWDMSNMKSLHHKIALPADNVTLVGKIGGAQALSVVDGYALLNGNMKNADISTRVKVGNGGSGAFWMIMRYNSENANLKVGYDFTTGNWEIKRTYMDLDKVIASVEDTLGVVSSGEWFDMDVRLEGQSCMLYVNGQQILSAPYVGISTHGRVGVMADGRSVMLDRISVRGDGRIMPGVDEFIFENAANSEFLGLADGSVLLIGGDGVVYQSTNEGKTWSRSDVTGLSYNTIRLQNGNILTIHRGSGSEPNTYWDYAYIYDELGGEPNGPYKIQTRVSNRITMNNKLIQTDSGRIIFCCGESGHGQESAGAICVYYSDNGGVTWCESKTPLNIDNTGINLQEGKVIELPDGTLRCYIRTDLGLIYMTDSKDGGVTWDLDLKKSQFMSTLCALNIERDPVDKNTYYMIWEYDNRNECVIAQFPRFRTSLAVSYDGCETWEYVTDLSSYDLMIDKTVPTEFRHMNEGLRVFDNYILADVCLYRTTATLPNQYVGAVWRIDKDMIRSTKRFPLTYRLPNTDLNE